MIDRNRRIKDHPEKFQLTEEQFDVIFTVEERVFDHVVECKNMRRSTVLVNRLAPLMNC
jgi:RNA polymerase II subunit A C-terminal domain phosphatase SSU72